MKRPVLRLSCRVELINYKECGVQKEKPLVGDKTYVEVDINGLLDELDVSESANQILSSNILNDTNIFSVLVEAIDKEVNVHYLRLSEDLLILVESEEIELKESFFYTIKVPVETLSVFPF